MRRRRAWLLPALAAVVYPLAVLAFSGSPSFPSRGDCSLAPTGEGELQVVFGYRDSEREALELREEVLAVGFEGTEVTRDGCGRVRVAVDDIPSQAIGDEVIRQARTVGLDPHLEQEGS